MKRKHYPADEEFLVRLKENMNDPRAEQLPERLRPENISALLDAAVSAHFDALHVADDLKPGMHVVLKPNLLAARKPELAVTTHPEVLAAIARWLRAHGIEHITLADSPGGLYTPAALRKVCAACQLTQLSDVLTLNADCLDGNQSILLVESFQHCCIETANYVGVLASYDAAGLLCRFCKSRHKMLRIPGGVHMRNYVYV